MAKRKKSCEPAATARGSGEIARIIEQCRNGDAAAAAGLNGADPAAELLAGKQVPQTPELSRGIWAGLKARVGEHTRPLGR